MPELPASVRLALWVTHAWVAGEDTDRALSRAMPDIDHIDGDVGRLRLWRELGEQALLTALPAPGDAAGMPSAPPEATSAAAHAGECVFVPGLGGLLVPGFSTYGPSGGAHVDVGTRVDWTAYESDPMPRHRVEAIDVGHLERGLREDLLAATASLERIGGQPFADRMGREMADAAIGARWGLPPDLPPRPARVIAMAGTVTTVTALALGAPDDALSASVSTQRRALIGSLQRSAERALAEAANAACAVLAGWRPA